MGICWCYSITKISFRENTGKFLFKIVQLSESGSVGFLDLQDRMLFAITYFIIQLVIE
jgi:hypothetical protein